MSNYLLSYNRVKVNEGGYNRAYGASGETYAGIDRLYQPAWQGWQIIDAYKAKFGTPANEAIINDPVLDSYVANFYLQYLNRLVNIQAIQNQTLADFTADFLIHKQYDAIKVINAVASIVKGAIGSTYPLDFANDRITDAVMYFMNSNGSLFYIYLKDARRKYYINPAMYGSSLKFSAALVASFIDRVNTFPVSA